MGVQVCMGAQMQCTFGAAPAVLAVLPANKVLTGTPAGTINNFVPMENIPTFGMCMAPANPEVISETAAALGVPTPAPCIPNTVAPWIPMAPTILIAGQPVLENDSQLMCIWGGVITISSPGQTSVDLP